MHITRSAGWSCFCRGTLLNTGRSRGSCSVPWWTRGGKDPVTRGTWKPWNKQGSQLCYRGDRRRPPNARKSREQVKGQRVIPGYPCRAVWVWRTGGKNPWRTEHSSDDLGRKCAVRMTCATKELLRHGSPEQCLRMRSKTQDIGRAREQERGAAGVDFQGLYSRTPLRFLHW